MRTEEAGCEAARISSHERTMSEEKTEDPTEKRLRDAREDGDTAKSTDLTDASSMAAAVAVLMLGAGTFAGACRFIMTTALAVTADSRDWPSLLIRMTTIGWQVLLIVVPVMAAPALVAIAVQIPQVGFQIALKPVTPDFERVHPVEGFKRIFSWRSVIELVKMIAKALLIGCVMLFTIRQMLPLIVGSLYEPLPELAHMFWSLLFKLCIVATLVFIVIGAIDVKLQSALFLRKMRMSKDEIKREHKEDEGDPKLKGERRRLAREFATSAPDSQRRVGLANALIVNPTHYAVAIRYAPDEYPLPLVTAKGMDETAAQLRRFAQRANVPIIGNPPVARALYKVGLDEPIPEELFETVAAILRWVDAIGAKKGDAPQSGMPA